MTIIDLDMPIGVQLLVGVLVMLCCQNRLQHFWDEMPE